MALAEADCHALAAAQQNFVVAAGQIHANQLVAFLQIDGNQTVLAQVRELAVRRFLNHPVARRHDKVVFARRARHRHHARHLFIRRNLDEVDNRRAARGASSFRNLVALDHVHAPHVGEEHDFVVRGNDAHLHGEVLFLRCHAGHAASAAVLRAVDGFRRALDVALPRQRDDHVLLLNQVFHVDFAVDGGQLRAARVSKFIADGADFGLDNLHQQVFVRQNRLEAGDFLLQIVVFLLEAVAFQTGQARQTHVQNRLRLLVGEVEPLHQGRFRGVGVFAGADDGHNLVDVVKRLQQTFQNMRAGERLVEVKARAAGDNVLLMLQIVVHHVAQGEDFRLPVDQREHVRAERLLHRRVLVERIQDDLRVNIFLQFDDDAHPLPVGLIADIADALNALVVHEFSNLLHQLRLVDLIRDFRHDDAAAAVGHFLDVGLCAHLNAPMPRVVGFADAASAEDDAACREVRAFDVLHQVVDGAVRVVNHADNAVDDLAEVMRGDVRCHADGNAAGTVDEQVREAAGQHGRLHERFVEVGVEIDRVLLDAFEQVGGQFRHAGFGVTHGGSAVAIHRAVVALPVHEGIADVEGLREAHHGIVDGGIAVRVKFAQHVADKARGFAVRLIGRHAEFFHIVEDAAVHRLQAVAHIRQRAVDDDRHCVGDERPLHLLFQIHRDEFVLNAAHNFSPNCSGFLSDNCLLYNAHGKPAAAGGRGSHCADAVTHPNPSPNPRSPR